MSQPPTILTLKQNFVLSQTRSLSQSISPSRAWQSSHSDSDDPLPEKAVSDALYRLNLQIQQHTRRVYAPQATRHVAEQIDSLYWNGVVTRMRDEEEEGEDEGLDVGIDFADPKIISTLPPFWMPLSPSQSSADPPSATHYADLVSTLQDLSSRHASATARLARLRRIHELVAPFADVDGVQENLVTRNGEVEKELQRMRVLLARVGGRVGQLREGEPRGGMEEVVVDLEGEEERKVGELLGRF